MNITESIEKLHNANKYFRGYWFICKRAKDRILPEGTYIEKHHVYPKGIYGENKELVKLTAKEHYLVHKMIWLGLKLKYGTSDIKTRKMAFAFSCMNMINKNHQRYKIKTAKEYELLRIACSEASKNKIVTEETKIKMSKFQKNKFVSDETKQKLSQSHKGQKAWNKGIKGVFKHSDETKKKIGNSSKLRTASDETKQKISIANKGHIHSEETRIKISQQIKKIWQNKRDSI